MTEIVFRVVKQGQFKDSIDAVFLGTDQLNRNQCYAHIGQHSEGDYNYFLQETRPATPEEYRDLLHELKSIGYNDLKILKRLIKK